MQPKETNKFYHGVVDVPKKGCKLVRTEKIVGERRGGVKRILIFAICIKHGVNVCRCGWEFGHHPVNQEHKEN